MIGLGAKSRFLQFLKCFWQQKLGKAELAVPFPESPFPRIGKTLASSSGALESGPGVFFGLVKSFCVYLFIQHICITLLLCKSLNPLSLSFPGRAVSRLDSEAP